jgi:adenylate kinase
VVGVNILLIGPPGSGKGTQGQRLSERLGLDHIAAGDLLRAEVAAGTPLGRQAAVLMQRGELVPDEVIIELVLPRVIAAAHAQGYLLDGFPRSVAQAEAVRHRAADEGAAPDGVLYLDVPRDELVRRILARSEIEGRPDDNEQTVANRLRVFAEATEPMVEHYRGRGLLHVIDATGTPDQVTELILASLA